jgi:hypothetical protein
MKLFLLLGAIFSQSLIADGIGFNVGPFSLQLSVDGPTFYEIQRPIVENPLCLAITQQNQLEFVVERAEKLNAKEVKIFACIHIAKAFFSLDKFYYIKGFITAKAVKLTPSRT